MSEAALQDPPRAPLPSPVRDGASVPLKSFAFHRNATFAGLLVGYAGYYLCRQNLSVAYLPMRSALGLDPLLFGKIASLGTLAYALGKFGFGPLGDSLGGRRTFLLGLFGSVAATVVLGLGSGTAFLCAAWCLNRLFQSMGWGGLVSVLARWYSSRSYGTAMGLISLSYQLGGVLASLFAGCLLSWGLGWRGLFLVPALALAAIGLASAALVVGSPEEIGHVMPGGAPPELPAGPGARPAASYFAPCRRVLSDRLFLLTCVLSFVLTLLRECFSLWTPAYFAEMGSSASAAALKSTVFPLLGCAGTLLAGWLSDRYLGGRRAPVMAVLLGGLVLCLLALGHLGAASSWACAHLSPRLDRGLLATLLVGAAGFFLLGPYSLVGGGVIALDFGGRRAASTAAGLLDGVGYLGAMLAGVGVAQVLVRSGWPLAFGLMAALALGGVLISLALWEVSPRA